MKIIKANVTATKIKSNDGFCWESEGEKYHYGKALSRATDGELFDVSRAPDGIVLKGDIVHYFQNENIAFIPHENQVSRKQSAKWDKENWIKCFGDDNHYYADVESITYKDPRSKVGRVRTDKVYGISIQEKTNVIVWRKNGKRTTTQIPIENVIERHLKTFED